MEFLMNKVICIQNCVSKHNFDIICNKNEIYEFSKEMSTDRFYFLIVPNCDRWCMFNRENFITFVEYREQQINSILD